MAKVTINALVDGGKATPAPPLGPALAPTGANIGQIIAEINKLTASFAGMQVPVKVEVDKGTKEFTIEVGTPPVSALIKKELGITENVKEEAGVKGKKTIGNLTLAQLKKVTSMKESGMLSKTFKASVKQVAGTCVSLGVTIEGKSAKDFVKEISEGKHDAQLQSA